MRTEYTDRHHGYASLYTITSSRSTSNRNLNNWFVHRWNVSQQPPGTPGCIPAGECSLKVTPGTCTGHISLSEARAEVPRRCRRLDDPGDVETWG